MRSWKRLSPLLGLVATLTASAAGKDVLPYGDPTAEFACPQCDVSPQELKATFKASSTLADGKGRYDAANAFDGNPDTAWCEGVKGSGVGESLTVTFPEPVHLEGFFLSGGYFKSLATLKENGRVARVTVTLDGTRSRTFTFADPTVPGRDASGKPVKSADAWFALARGHGAKVDGLGGETRSIKLVINGVHPGAKYEDTCISDVRLVLARPADLNDEE
jgi:hypothetical protein